MDSLEKEQPATTWERVPVSWPEQACVVCMESEADSIAIGMCIASTETWVKVGHWTFVRPSATQSDK